MSTPERIAAVIIVGIMVLLFAASMCEGPAENIDPDGVYCEDRYPYPPRCY